MLTWKPIFMAVLFLNNVASQKDDYENVSVELQLANYDLADAYDEISQAHKNILLDVGGFDEKIKLELSRGIIMRQQHESNLDLETKVPADLQRNWTLLTRSGDFLLQENDYEMLIEFHNANEQLVFHSKLACINDKQNCSINKQDFKDILAQSRNAHELSKFWKERQDLFVENSHQFGDVLALVNKAYVPNGQHSSTAYWEMLSEYEDGYAKANALWSEILPLYKKLHTFVKTRLYKYYNITSTSDLIPVYLLGSNFGNDWSNIANIILPHPYLYTEVNKELQYQTIKSIFKGAEKTCRQVGLNSLGSTFFSESLFNYTDCGPYIFSHCGSHKSELLTCSKLEWNEYLDIYEASIDIVLRSEDYQSFPRTQTRFSIVDEALKGLGSILAINDLSNNEIVQNIDDKYNRKNTSLLLMALRILPKLAYYIVADTWRLDELKFSSGNFTERWWKNRSGVQGVQGISGLEPDYLADPYITSNKPYLSKFFGLFLQFQIMDYYQIYFAKDNETIAQAISHDENFKKFIKDRPNKIWLDLMSTYYGINEVSSTAFLEYFKPLADYLDHAPDEQIIIPIIPNPRRTSTLSSFSKGFNKTANVALLAMRKSNETEDVTWLKQNEILATATKATLTGTVGVFSAIAGLIVVGILVLFVVHMLKRKQQRYIINRRHEIH